MVLSLRKSALRLNEPDAKKILKPPLALAEAYMVWRTKQAHCSCFRNIDATTEHAHS